MKKYLSWVLLVLFVVAAVTGCGGAKEQPKEQPKPQVQGPKDEKTLVLSTTTSTKDSGLLNVLVPVFEQKSGLKVKVLSQGTGQALKTGELGDCDVVLVHSRTAEDKFVADGFGVNRKDVMYNDFVIVGPAADPAKVKGLAVVEAMKKFSVMKKGEFISRGDDSGTHKKELELWQKAAIKPEGQWYLSVAKGMGDTLVMTNEKEAYTLADRGTYASMVDKLKLAVLVEGDPLLLNPYGVIAVNPQKHPGVNNKGATAFIDFITSQEAKDLINNYKVNGQQLFYTK